MLSNKKDKVSLKQRDKVLSINTQGPREEHFEDPIFHTQPGRVANRERAPVCSTRQRPRLLRVLLLALLHDAKVLQAAEWLATLSTRSGT